MSLEEDGFAALVGWTLLTPEIPDLVGDDGIMTVGDDMTAGDDVEEDPSLPALTGNLYEVGEITDFIDIPNNPCIEVETENGAVMIPLHEDLILSIDPEYQEIIMQIPAGLL